MPIKSFRGQIADLSTDVISLHTNTGSTGYRIVKLQLMAALPGAQTQESVLKIYKIPQTAGSEDAKVDFSDQTLLGVGYYRDNNNDIYPTSSDIIFDNEIINQDIYITHKDVAVGQSVNYYIELEMVKLSLDENTVATLKDIRNIETDPTVTKPWNNII